MAFDPTRRDLTVAVVGTGAMGRGIMQVCAQGDQASGGMRVIAYDEKPGAAEAARDFIARTLAGLVEKGRLNADDVKLALERISIAQSFDDLARADVVIEAVLERIDVKQALFQRLDALCPPGTILASNTSSLAITAIAARCARHPERVGGMHFFNPVPVMKPVEVVPGLRTAPWVTEAMMALGRRMTREPVLCIDSPGFIVNHAGRGIREAERIQYEGIASAHDIDRIMCGAPGLRLGPFALFDMVGIDVSHTVHESFFNQFYGEPAYQPHPPAALRLAGGLFGAKTGQGWYAHKDGKRVEPPIAPAPKGLPPSVWVLPSKSHPDLQEPLVDLIRKAGVTVESGAEPSREAVIVVTPIGYDLTTAVSELKLDAARAVAVDVLFGLKGPRTLMVTPATRAEVRDAAHALLAADGKGVVVINDSPGFVAQRIVAMIVNVGCGMAQKQIAVPADIDKAVVLGLSYPMGPFAWGDAIGPARVQFILERLQSFYGEDRYRPSPWLKRRVALGLPLSAPEGKLAS